MASVVMEMFSKAVECVCTCTYIINIKVSKLARYFPYTKFKCRIFGLNEQEFKE